MVKFLDMENFAARSRRTAGFSLKNGIIDETKRQEKDRPDAEKRWGPDEVQGFNAGRKQRAALYQRPQRRRGLCGHPGLPALVLRRAA